MAVDVFESIASRLSRIIAILGMAGALAAFAWAGWPAGLGFAAGAAAAWFNFRWMKGFVAGLGPDGKPSKAAILFVFRYLILGAGAYVIVKLSKTSLLAALAGLFLPLAAVIIEVLLQLGYARRTLDH
jgi:hypothetical protein